MTRGDTDVSRVLVCFLLFLFFYYFTNIYLQIDYAHHCQQPHMATKITAMTNPVVPVTTMATTSPPSLCPNGHRSTQQWLETRRTRLEPK
jgi:hypothetical protein